MLGETTTQPFADPIESPFGLEMNTDVYFGMDFVDLDNDGDLDLVQSAATDWYLYERGFYYYENIGTSTSPEFSVPEPDDLRPFEMGGQMNYNYPRFADMDGDGDYDMIQTGYQNFYSEYYGSVTWYYRNIGTPETPDFFSIGSIGNIPKYTTNYIFPADMDGDGDMDFIFKGEDFGSDHFYYCENISVPPGLSFKDPVILDFGSENPHEQRMIDWDNDGDLDMIARGASTEGMWLDFYENSGTSTSFNFEVPQEDFLNLKDIFAAHEPIFHIEIEDLDADGDFDIIATTESGLGNGSKFLFYENLSTTTSVNQVPNEEGLSIRISPNPAEEELSISTSETLERIVIFDVSGKEILSILNPANTIDISNLDDGIYLIQTISISGSILSEKFTKI